YRSAASLLHCTESRPIDESRGCPIRGEYRDWFSLFAPPCGHSFTAHGRRGLRRRAGSAQDGQGGGPEGGEPVRGFRIGRPAGAASLPELPWSRRRPVPGPTLRDHFATLFSER